MVEDYKNPLFDNYGELLKIPERFNPQEGLKYVRKLTGEERVIAMKVWKQRLKEQLDIIASIPKEVKNISEGMDFSKLPKDEIILNIVKRLQPMFEKLSIKQREQVLEGIEKFVDRKTVVHRYVENPLYKDNPKQLITDALGVNSSKLKGDITVEVDGANFTFYADNSDDYKLLLAYGDKEKANNSLLSGGVSMDWTKIEELKGTITLVNGPNDGNLYRKLTQIHETRHATNKIIMPDYGKGDKLTRAKDEIIAYLIEGTSINDISLILNKKGQWALYDYYKEVEQTNPERYKKLIKLYEQELLSAINIAEKMQQANIPNYLDILAITPVRQWGNLEKIYFVESISLEQKILKTILMIFEKTGETYFALRNDIVHGLGNNMGNFTFYAPQALGIKLIFLSYLDEYYPNWINDLKDNEDKFLGKMKILLNPTELQKYLENFGK